ncbi:hypothetical protein BKA70DRAFT_1527141 [Coprinopsis sp. MPI-PUGE-AT-0042]|nr:hypothetical protein BKA70DRAFT_1527141 [Coprinopsis sp. MPI-PUGE-AT-0042]
MLIFAIFFVDTTFEFKFTHVVPYSFQRLADLLEAVDVGDRLHNARAMLKKELIDAELASKLSQDVDSKIAKRQRDIMEIPRVLISRCWISSSMGVSCTTSAYGPLLSHLSFPLAVAFANFALRPQPSRRTLPGAIRLHCQHPLDRMEALGVSGYFSPETI